MSEYALRLANGADTAARVRMADALALRPSGALNARTGLRNDGGGAVTVVAGTMNVQVSPLMAWVDGGASNAQGGYPFVLDATKTLTLADGHATLSRTDTIAVVIHDNAFDGSGLTDAAVTVVQGTPGAGAPTLPTNCLPLRDVTVPATTSTGTGGLSSGNLSTDRRAYLAAAGGLLRVASQTVRDALTSPQKSHAVYREDTGNIEVYNGTSWDVFTAGLVQAGTASVSTGGASTGTLAVVFAKAYATAPVVQATSQSINYFATVTSVTATGFTVKITHYDAVAATQTVAVGWTARPATQ